MANLINTWKEEKLKYQQRYAYYCKQYQKSKETNKELLGHLLECSYVLITIFGLSPKEVNELEYNNFCGMTSADIESL